ncbi:MAG TPA: response regulator [Candidatus Paceibacterota bacterium]|nr:response regulator [Candidatus Paceibacterota bacterium]
MTILVVDDEPDIRGIVADVSRMVAKSASPTATVLEAESAEAALDLIRLRGYSPELVISDMTMPGRNGLEMAKIIKKLLPRTPVIILTADPLREDVSLPVNVTRVLIKPVTCRELLAAIKSALAGKNSTATTSHP